MLRLLKEMPKIEFPIIDPSLSVLRVGISLWEPDSSYKHLPTPPSECAICGSGNFEVGERLSALLMPRFDYGENGLEYVMQVWVHPTCYENVSST